MTKSAFKLKGSLFTLTIMMLVDVDLNAFRNELQSTIEKSPQFFQHAPIVLDVSELIDKQTVIDFSALITIMREYSLIPIGVRGANEALKKSALAAGLAILTTTTNTNNTADIKTKTATKTETVSKTPITKMITQSIRSGQQVYAEGGDLIIIGSVSPGAEILADGNIHVYGSLRGRVLAGIMGDTSARIFCKSLEAELISIAGRYLVSENITAIKNKPATQIFLDNNQLKIEEV